MGAWEPRVERKESRLQCERDTEQEEDGVSPGARLRQEGTKSKKVGGVGLAVKQHERRDQNEQTNVCGDEIVETSEANLLISIVTPRVRSGATSSRTTTVPIAWLTMDTRALARFERTARATAAPTRNTRRPRRSEVGTGAQNLDATEDWVAEETAIAAACAT